MGRDHWGGQEGLSAEMPCPRCCLKEARVRGASGSPGGPRGLRCRAESLSSSGLGRGRARGLAGESLAGVGPSLQAHVSFPRCLGGGWFSALAAH